MKDTTSNNAPLDLSKENYLRVFHSLYGQGLTPLALLLISEAASWQTDGKVLFAAQDTLADRYNVSRCTINRTIKRLIDSNHLVGSVHKGSRLCELTLGAAALALLTKACPKEQEAAPAPAILPQKEERPEPIAESRPKVERPAEPTKTTPAPQPVKPIERAPRIPYLEYDASNTERSDWSSDVKYSIESSIADADFRSLTLWPAKGRGLSRQDVAKLFRWQGITGERYVDDYIESGLMPSDLTDQLDKCRTYASDLHYRLGKIHERAIYGYDSSWDN